MHSDVLSPALSSIYTFKLPVVVANTTLQFHASTDDTKSSKVFWYQQLLHNLKCDWGLPLPYENKIQELVQIVHFPTTLLMEYRLKITLGIMES